MPTYEYRCTSCDYYFEKFQSIKDEPVKICPKCGEPVRKLFSSSAGLIFKGSGFYITDYKRKHTDSGSSGNGKPTPSNTRSGEKKASENTSKTTDSK